MPDFKNVSYDFDYKDTKKEGENNGFWGGENKICFMLYNCNKCFIILFIFV